MAEKEKQEVQKGLEAVQVAEEKVEKIKAEKAAKKAARCAKRLEWKGPFKLVGKLINAYDEKPVEMWTGTLLGGAVGAAAVFGGQKLLEKFGKKDEEETVEEETPILESETAPFDTEA